MTPSKLSGRVHFDVSSREPFLQRALGTRCWLLRNQLSLSQPQFYSAEGQPALTHMVVAKKASSARDEPLLPRPGTLGNLLSQVPSRLPSLV